MFKLGLNFGLLFVSFLVLPVLNAADLEIYVPKNGVKTVWLGTAKDPKQAMLSATNGKYLVHLDDGLLDPRLHYTYRVTVVSDNNAEVVKDIELKINSTVKASFTDDFAKKAPAGLVLPGSYSGDGPNEKAALAAGKFTSKIPDLIKKNEALADIYTDFVSKSAAPTKKDMHLDDVKKYKCSIWKIQESNSLDREIVLDGTSAGGDRFIHLSAAELIEDIKDKFLLTKKSTGWRGISSKKSDPKTNETLNSKSLGDTDPRLVPQGPAPGYKGPYDRVESIPSEAIGFSADLVKSVQLAMANTACITTNRDNDHEIFIELGRKNELVFYDAANNEVDISNIPNFTMIRSTFQTIYKMKNDYSWNPSDNVSKMEYERFGTEAFSRLINSKKGNHSFPDSYCFSDATDARNVYKMTHLGICSLSVK